MNNFLRNIACLSGVVLLTAACARDIPLAVEIAQTEGEMVTIDIRVRVPDLSKNATTRAADAAFENGVDNLTVVWGKRDGGMYRLNSLAHVTKYTMVNATTAAFTLSVEATGDPVKMLVLANDPSLLTAYNTPEAFEGSGFNGMELEEWKAAMICNAASDANGFGQSRCMPMTGEIVLQDIRPGQNINVAIPLMRTAAKADLRLNLVDGSKSFVPTDAAVVRGRRFVHLFPFTANLASDNTGKVVAPSPYTDAASDGFAIDVEERDAATGTIATTYVNETSGISDVGKQTAEATCIVVGGYYNGSTTKSWYRVDFNSGLDGHPFGQILRNHHYVFDITKVTSSGFSTAEDAATNIAGSMQIEVEMWDQNVQQVNFVDSGDYMYVDTGDVVLSYNQGAQGSFTVRSTLDFAWRLNGGAGLASNGGTQTATNEYYSVTMAPGVETNGYRDYAFTVTALQDNLTDDKREATVSVTAKGATISAKIAQKWAAVTDRKVHVLSLGNDAGGLGRYFDDAAPADNIAPSGNGVLRNILLDKRWFGPDGVVKCGGFTFDLFTTDNVYSYTNVSVDQLKRALESTDILILPYICNPSQSVTDVILDWAQKPYHVLFVTADSGIGQTLGAATNVNVRNSLNARGDGLKWIPMSDLSMPTSSSYANVNNYKVQGYLGNAYLQNLAGAPSYSVPQVMVKSMIVANPNASNAPFIQGPFGMPDQGAASTPYQYTLWNNVSEVAVPAETSTVTPLAVFQVGIWGTYVPTVGDQRTKIMLVGVDVPRTTVYIGESELLTTHMRTVPPYDNSGTAAYDTPYWNSVTMLMSNVWAWAVNNVLAQVKEE